VAEIVLGLGGSAMSDGGSGALRALGLKSLDSAGNVVPLGGGFLADVVALDASELDPRLSSVKFRIAVDVQNPLFGPQGAAHVFGPQKGADEDAVEKLDAGLRNWASLLREATGRDVNVPGAGVAGGFPASFLAFTDAALVAGFTGLGAHLNEADLVTRRRLHGRAVTFGKGAHRPCRCGECPRNSSGGRGRSYHCDP
jgi:glycerate kinase